MYIGTRIILSSVVAFVAPDIMDCMTPVVVIARHTFFSFVDFRF